MKKMTIGSAVYNDPQGIWYTYQSIRLNNKDILNDIELIVIDNNPSSQEGKDTKNICDKLGMKYVPYDKKRSTAVRNEIFTNATAPFCFSIDSHVLFEPDTIKRLIKWTEENPDCEDLLQGPMLHDSLNPNNRDMSTHMNPIWRAHMFGVWGFDDRAVDMNNEPFEIQMHGLGLFGCKTDTWLGFHDLFKGFGGEEGYIHEKYRKNGRKTLCLPFLRWLHKFRLSDRPPYPLPLSERINNYIVGHLDNELPLEPVEEHFAKDFAGFDALVEEVKVTLEVYKEVPALVEEQNNYLEEEKRVPNSYQKNFTCSRRLPLQKIRVRPIKAEMPCSLINAHSIITNNARLDIVKDSTLIDDVKEFEINTIEMTKSLNLTISCEDAEAGIYLEGSVSEGVYIPLMECK